MANEAHKEPTMEEILASIRKIISEDDASNARRPGTPTAVREEPAVEDDDYSEPAFESAEDELDEVMFDSETDEDYETFESDDADFEPDAGGAFQGVLDAARAAEMSQPEPTPVFRHDPEPEPAPSPTPAPAPRPAPRPQAQAPKETDMPASTRYQQTVLTDDNTADAAAGSLGKLISKMDLGGDNTIEGLVRELLKPMIKEWLDANLPSIVEQKVEAEVQRIARMAR